MGVTQYIGARYVPLFADPAEWTKTRTYEPLTIVLHEGNSYTSKQFVPVGIDINETAFWAETGNYNAQVEAYRQEVLRNQKDVEYLKDEFLKCVKGYKTVSDMKQDTNLEANMYAKTMGYYEPNDGGSALYFISNDGTPNDRDTIQLNNGMVANMVYQEFNTIESVGFNSIENKDAAPYINYLIENNKNVMLLNKTYNLEGTVTISAPITLTGKGRDITFLNYKGNQNAITILPAKRYGGKDGFTISNLGLYGDPTKNQTGIFYNNRGTTDNFIAHWLFEDMNIYDFHQGVYFENEVVGDGYFVGGFNRFYSNSPLDFVRAGDSWYIANSQFAKGDHGTNGKVTMHSQPAGATCVMFFNNNYTAEGLELNGSGISLYNNQFETMNSPAIKISGYNNVIRECNILSHQKDYDGYLVELNVADTGNYLQNTIDSCMIHIPPNNTNCVTGNNKVNINNCTFINSEGAVRPLDSSYVPENRYIDLSKWTFTPVDESISIASQDNMYKNGKVILNISAIFTGAVSNNSDLFNTPNGVLLKAGQFIDSVAGQYDASISGFKALPIVCGTIGTTNKVRATTFSGSTYTGGSIKLMGEVSAYR